MFNLNLEMVLTVDISFSGLGAVFLPRRRFSELKPVTYTCLLFDDTYRAEICPDQKGGTGPVSD